MERLEVFDNRWVHVVPKEQSQVFALNLINESFDCFSTTTFSILGVWKVSIAVWPLPNSIWDWNRNAKFP